MEDDPASKEVLKTMYENFIEIANKTVNSASFAEDVVTANECRKVLRSRLNNLIE